MRKVGYLLLAALVAGTVALIAVPPAPPPAYTPSTELVTELAAPDLDAPDPPGSDLPVVAFLGDTFTAGSPKGGDPRNGQNYALEVSARSGWAPALYAVEGTGFLQTSRGGKDAFGSRVAEVVAARPHMVVVQGGYHDLHFAPAAVGAEARRVLAALRAALPRAKIVVIGPVWPGGDRDPRVQAVDAALAAAAGAARVPFVDALAEGWFAGASRQLVDADGVHPTDAGHHHMAEVLRADLGRLGLA